MARLEGHSSWVSAVAWDTTSYFGGRYRIGSAGQDAKIALWDFTVDALHLRSHHRPSKVGSLSLRPFMSWTWRSSSPARESIETRFFFSFFPAIRSPSRPHHPLRCPVYCMGAFCLDSLSPLVQAKNGPVNAAGSTTQAGTKLLTGKLGRGFRSTVSSGPSVSSESSDSQSTTPIIQKEALGRAEVPILEPLVDHIAHNEPMTDILFTTDAIVTACTGGKQLPFSLCLPDLPRWRTQPLRTSLLSFYSLSASFSRSPLHSSLWRRINGTPLRPTTQSKRLPCAATNASLWSLSCRSILMSASMSSSSPHDSTFSFGCKTFLFFLFLAPSRPRFPSTSTGFLTPCFLPSSFIPPQIPLWFCVSLHSPPFAVHFHLRLQPCSFALMFCFRLAFAF